MDSRLDISGMTAYMNNHMRFKLIPITVAVLLSLVVPIRAHAHAYPDHADPKVGSTISASPAKVRIWFDSALEPAFCSIMVHIDKGAMVDKRDGHVDPSDPTLLEISVPPLPPGPYRVYWSVVARDGHRTSGDYTFTIK
jgi:copper resistance protein C